MAKDIKYNEEVRNLIVSGVKQLADAVRITMGPKGRNVILEKSYGAPTIANDGVTIAKEIELENRFENMGAQLVKEVASNTNDNAGDGTSTATLLCWALIAEGVKLVKSGTNPVRLKQGILMAAEYIAQDIEKNAHPVTTKEKIAQVATISAQDEKVGELLAELEEQLKTGVITVEEGQSAGTEKEVVEGMQFDNGYVSPYMVTDTGRMEAIMENPYILLTDKKISSIKEILPLVESLAQAGKKDLVIIAEDLDGEALATLVVNKLRGTFNALAIKAPAFGDRRKEILKDIAALTGGRVISEEVGLKLDQATIEDLGQAGKVISNKDNSTIVDGKGNKTDIQARIAEIDVLAKNSTSDFDKEKLAERRAKMTGGVAVIRVGAATETELKEKKLRIEDALNATRAAYEGGIIPGGGVAYLFASLKLKDIKNDDEDIQMGINLVQKALEYPIKQIAENAGHDGDAVMEKVLAGKPGHGYDAAEEKYNVDMEKAGIIDPAKVAVIALLNAASMAGIFLTTEAGIVEIPKPETSMPAMPGGGMPGMGGMGGMM
jgi:chaperonin GroEL